jgi:hypothetical protein
MAKRNHHLEPAGIERIGHKPMPGKANLPTKVDDPRFMFGMVTGIPATLEISVPLLPAGELYVSTEVSRFSTANHSTRKDRREYRRAQLRASSPWRMAGFFE